MRRVLVVGSDFAPSSLPPATRIRFFANHLPEFGWEPIILTVAPEYYEWPVDPENEKLIPPSLPVTRTRALSARWTRKLGIGDIGLRSFWHQWRAVKRLCRTQKIDLILIPVPPYVPMVLGRLAHRKFGLPYVIDYIDPWVTDSYNQLPRHQRPPKWVFADLLSRTLEPFALKRVAHITGVSRGTTDSVINRYEWLSEADATELPYGGEAGDFEYLRAAPRKNSIFDRTDGLIHLSYVGACIPGMHATVRALFAGVRLGLDRAPEKFASLRFHFVGTSYGRGGPQSVMALAAQAGIESLVDERAERIPYLESLQVMLDSHGLFLVGSDEPHYTASKVFPYILARKPVLAIFHEASSVVRILTETQTGTVVTFNATRRPDASVPAISAALERILELPSDYQPGTRWEAFEPYTTRAMAERLAQVFDKVVAEPGSADEPNAMRFRVANSG